MESGVNFKDLDVSHQLPSKKTAVQVFSDFLAYLFKCTKEYIIEARANGASLWDSVQDSVEVVLTHPNGWEGLQQGKMRDAAILAGIIADTPEGHARVHFVSEGEASLHYCIDTGLTSEFEVRDVSASHKLCADVPSGWNLCHCHRRRWWHCRRKQLLL